MIFIIIQIKHIEKDIINFLTNINDKNQLFFKINIRNLLFQIIRKSHDKF